ncbi:MAG: hypothetical protein K6G26_01405, partial [Lachnospiraceae bacterium]|nr:hypothetical protein [Lachnospiraceae bacterium]
RTLGLAGNKIKKINTLGKMKWLSRLDLADNGITNWDDVDELPKVNGRPYKLHVNLIYQRNMSDYEGWKIHTWRRDPKLDYDMDLPLDLKFPVSTSSSKLEFDMDMVEDYFQFIIQMEEKPSVKDIESNRTIDVALTKGDVNIKVCIYEGNETPIVIMENE